MPGIIPKWQEVLHDHETHRRHVSDEVIRLQHEEGVPYGEAQHRAEAKFAHEKVLEVDLYDAIAMRKRAELDAAREAQERLAVFARRNDA